MKSIENRRKNKTKEIEKKKKKIEEKKKEKKVCGPHFFLRTRSLYKNPSSYCGDFQWRCNLKSEFLFLPRR